MKYTYKIKVCEKEVFIQSSIPLSEKLLAYYFALVINNEGEDE